MSSEQRPSAYNAAVLEVATSPVASGSRTLQKIIGERYGAQVSLSEVLTKVSEAVKALASEDPTLLNEVLATQALLLDQAFQHCLEQGLAQRGNRAAAQEMLLAAFKAQSMSRQTLEAIAAINAREKSAKAKRVRTRLPLATNKRAAPAAKAQLSVVGA